MVNEKEEHYEEEGEYHFSDDQVNYDVEPETAAPKAATTSAFTKEALLEKFNQHRRKILGAFSLIVLVGVVYKILVPASTAPATEFKQAAVPARVEKTTAPATMKSPPVAPVASQPAAIASQPATEAAAPATPSVSPAGSPVIPAVSTAPPPSVMQPAPVVQEKTVSPAQQNQPPAAMVVVTSPPPAAPVATTTQQQPSAPVYGMPPNVQPSTMQPPLTQTAGPMNMPPLSVDAQTKERIAALEQQNTAMMNLLQTEYAQKIADNETQSNAVRGKMEELTKRVNRMETNLNQIMQILQGASNNRPQPSGLMGGIPPMTMLPPNVGARAAEPRMIYSVQAIIPGRAWLKSESGDTVTVAEGDYLKKYGRVTKIDPYDGIVAIDTGSRVITLSYGVDGD